jgi:hypothetical protein
VWWVLIYPVKDRPELRHLCLSCVREKLLNEGKVNLIEEMFDELGVGLFIKAITNYIKKQTVIDKQTLLDYLEECVKSIREDLNEKKKINI